jgi:hypothetical protein
MAKVARNDRCRCGSGRKAKRCCGPSAGPAPEDRARAELSELTRILAPPLARHSDEALHALLAEVPELPDHDLSLAWALPRHFPPELEALRRAIHDDDLDAVKEALPPAVAALDSQVGRAHLARAVLAVRDAGRVHPDLAAAAVVDLASGSPQLVTASIVQAVLVDVGATATPAGLVLSRP